MALLKKAAVFIPSPNVTDNQQFKNANAVARQGGALLIEEKDIAREKMRTLILQVLDDPKMQTSMGEKIYSFAVPDANKQIYEDICRLIGR